MTKLKGEKPEEAGMLPPFTQTAAEAKANNEESEVMEAISENEMRILIED